MRTMQWIALIAHLICVLPMFHKRARQGQDEHDPTKRFRANLGDLFLANEVSGARTQSLFSDAQRWQEPSTCQTLQEFHHPGRTVHATWSRSL